MTEPLRETQDSASPPLGALPAALPPTSAVLPTRDLVLFPYMVAPLMISRSISAAAVQRALATPERVLFVCLQRQAEQELPGPTGLHEVGTLATILRVTPLSDGRTKLVVQGLQQLEHDLPDWPYFQADGEPLTGYQQLADFRAEAGAFINAPVEEIAFTQNATMGMSFLANGCDLAAGDEVLTTDQEHSGGIGGFRLRAKRHGVVVKE